VRSSFGAGTTSSLSAYDNLDEEYLATPDGIEDPQCKEAVAENKALLVQYRKHASEIATMLSAVGYDRPLHGRFVEAAQWDPAAPLPPREQAAAEGGSVGVHL
jgi:hypothetical protein